MAVRLRLQRVGRKNYAQWRVVVTDRHKARDAQCLEVLGWYDAHRKDGTEKVDLDRVQHWISLGAEPTPAVKQIVKRFKQRQAAVAKA